MATAIPDVVSGGATSNTLIASGGAVTISGGTVSHTYTASGTFSVYQAGVLSVVNVTGGGSSAGGLSTGSNAVGAYSITVGGGGSVVLQYPTDGLLAGLYATGGTIAVDGDYIRHTFTTSGSFALAQSGLLASEYLVVAGGGGGGGRSGGGGGGAGGMLTGSTNIVANQTVTIGAGGSGASTGTTNDATNGGNSSLGTIATATGGGRGGGGDTQTGAAATGGSGGGGGSAASSSGAAGTGGQGSSGGNFAGGAGAGGGGASAAGSNGNVSNGAGGAGTAWNGTTYAGGGGGGGGVTGGAGGAGGGGAGGNNDVNGTAATANTGGGGGAGGSWATAPRSGANGGSGIVIVRYQPGAFQPGHPLGFSATNVLQGWWKLDEAAGTTATDSSGNSRNGTYAGTYTLQGQTGDDGVLYADFGGGQVTIADNNVFSANNASGLTVVGLIRPEAAELAGTTRKFIISKGNTVNQFEWAFHVSNTVAGRLRFDFWDLPGATMSNEFIDGTLTANQWSMVVGASAAPVFNQRFDLYSDTGSPVASSQAGTSNVAYSNGTADVCIGNRADNPASQQWNGGLANLMIFSGKMAQASVSKLRNWLLAQGWSV